jgi:hypothetical protein
MHATTIVVIDYVVAHHEEFRIKELTSVPKRDV